jgi:hypothetical protein
LLPADEGVGVAENPRSGVGARGSSVKNGLSWAKPVRPPTSTALPLLNLLTVPPTAAGDKGRNPPSFPPKITMVNISFTASSLYENIVKSHRLLEIPIIQKYRETAAGLYIFP